LAKRRRALARKNYSVCILSSVHSALDNRIFYREARSLQRAGYDVTLIAVHERNQCKDGTQIIGLPHLPRWQRPLVWLKLLRHALSRRADVYHFHDPELLLIMPCLRLLTGKPTIYDVHEAYADFIEVKGYIPAWLRHPLAWMFGRLEPLAARMHSALIFADDQVASSFRDVQRSKATLFNYPALSFVKNAVATTQHIGQRQPIVLHLGTHEESRGIYLMIEAFRQVLRDLPEARLLLVGPFVPTELERRVRSEIVQRGIQHAVTITGRILFEEVDEYLKRAAVGWVTLQPVSKYQKNIPTKLFEYMAYGIPIVSSDLSPIRPFVENGEDGYLVAADDPQAHARAILTLLRQPQVALAMGQKGQDLVRTCYNWDEMEKRLLALYQELLG
jgi:glycosyltransferase involved in cell wall biosynthesis